MPFPKGPSPYKGVPKSEWPRIKAEQEAKKTMTTPAQDLSAVVAATITEEAPRVNSDDAPTEIFRDMFNGTLKTLDVMGKNGSTLDPLPGFVLYWFTDVNGNGEEINKAKMSGYTLVNKDEILLTENIVGNNDLGSHVRKVVNTRTVPPEYGYLMKKPVELHEQHLREREKVHQRIDQALRSGTLGRKSGDGQYTKDEVPSSSIAPINISSKLYTENRNG